MKPLFVLLIIFFLNKPDSVWICTGKYSKAYHKKAYCKGLRNCKGDEIKVPLKDAIYIYHRKPCGYCER
ncbi:hypothetical protein BDD43_3691 [Mucilaginibacter gracilis]|uniref:Uncharacterized protein n=1 Tax=Mucilaginibacter gracilis TaxID=423350 RepID=A0A495J4F9_9SPHI|nr:hypothetical protein BDD43_3691 [Mucilaginibacter gracilis]